MWDSCMRQNALDYLDTNDNNIMAKGHHLFYGKETVKTFSTTSIILCVQMPINCGSLHKATWWPTFCNKYMCMFNAISDNFLHVLFIYFVSSLSCFPCSENDFACHFSCSLWDLGQQRCVHSYAVHTDSVWALASTPTFSHVYSGGRDLSVS